MVQPKPQVEAMEAVDAVDKLTDEAITKRIAAIGRLIHTQAGYRDDAQAEIDKLINEKAMLIEVKIARLKAQLPRPVEARAGEKDGSE